MVEGHLNQGNFDPDVIKLGSKLVDASIELHRHVMNNFLPSAVKFHYQFNLRELSNITQVGGAAYELLVVVVNLSSLVCCHPLLCWKEAYDGSFQCPVCISSSQTTNGSLYSAQQLISAADQLTQWLFICAQGLLRMNKDYFREPIKVVRLWVHECERVLADRMINDTDMTKFNEFRITVTKKYFDDVNQVTQLWQLSVLEILERQIQHS